MDRERVRQLLLPAAQLTAAEREAFLRAECGADLVLRAEVESLLAFTPIAASIDRPLPELLGLVNPSDEFAPGTMLRGRYQVDSKLAASGFATVYLAHDHQLPGRRVVIKCLDRAASAHLGPSSFASELAALSRLQHPNIVGISDAGELNGRLFLVLAYVPGQTLREVLAQGPLEPARASALLEGIARAVNAGHQEQIYHRDLKPSNVIVSNPGTTDERVTVIDFGSAQLATAQPLPVHSPAYAHPKTTDGISTDLFALALIACELFGSSPWVPGQPLDAQIPAAMPGHLKRTVRRALRPPITNLSAASFYHVPPGLGRAPVLVAVAALIAVVAVMIRLSQSPSTGPLPMLQTRPLVTSPESQQEVEFSADGQWVYYSSGQGRLSRIYRVPAAGGTPEPLTPRTTEEGFPSASPDGRWLSFYRRLDREDRLIIRSLKTGEEFDRGGAPEVGRSSWSADSQALIVSAGESGRSRLHRVNLQTGAWVPLFPPSADVWEEHPRISPRGDELAFVRSQFPLRRRIWRVALDRTLKPLGEPRPVLEKPERIDSLQWTPDSRSLVYLAGPFAHPRVYRLTLSDGVSRELPTPDRPVHDLAIPRQKWSFAYSFDLSDTNVSRLELGGAHRHHTLIEGTFDDEEPAYSPDGQWIAFASARTGSGQVWLSRADGSHPLQLTSFLGLDAAAFAWLPDSQTLLMTDKPLNGPRSLWSVATNPPAPPRRLREIDGAISSVSADGSRLYFYRNQKGQSDLWRTDYPKFTREERVTWQGGQYALESADGRTLYFAKNDPLDGLWRMDLPSGTPQRVVPDLYRRTLFALGRQGVYYIAINSKTELPALYFLRYGTEQAVLLHSFERDIFWGLSLSPDERHLLFSLFNVANLDIMIASSFAP